MIFLRKALLVSIVLCGAILSGCSAQDPSALELPAPTADESVDASVETSQCKNDIITTKNDSLVAERFAPGDTHYIEFRLRASPVLPSGHMYVVYGKLNEAGKPISFNYTGLYPKGSVVGLYTGIFIPVDIPANTEPSLLDCNFRPMSAYRRSINDTQYKALLARIAQFKRNSPKWRMLSFNCNHYSAALGEAVGLKSPTGARSLQFLSTVYFNQYVRVNGDKISRKSHTTNNNSR